MNIAVSIPTRMTVEQYLDWSETLPDTESYELVAGVPVAMAGDSIRHNLTKFAAARTLENAVRSAGLSCTVFIDGVNVKIDAWTVRIPDCSVQCGPLNDLTSVFVEPIIVVEVTSPKTTRTEFEAKLIEYFSLPSVQHYLIIQPEPPVVVHHAREATGDIRTRILRHGEIALTLPGMIVSVADLLGTEPQKVSN